MTRDIKIPHFIHGDDPVLNGLMADCINKFNPPLPCKERDYLMARHKYHAELVKRGLLRPELAEPMPA